MHQEKKKKIHGLFYIFKSYIFYLYFLLIFFTYILQDCRLRRILRWSCCLGREVRRVHSPESAQCVAAMRPW